MEIRPPRNERRPKSSRGLLSPKKLVKGSDFTLLSVVDLHAAARGRSPSLSIDQGCAQLSNIYQAKNTRYRRAERQHTHHRRIGGTAGAEQEFIKKADRFL